MTTAHLEDNMLDTVQKLRADLAYKDALIHQLILMLEHQASQKIWKDIVDNLSKEIPLNNQTY